MIKPYDYLELLKAIRTCVRKPYYKAGVFTITMQDAKLICADAMDAIIQDDEEMTAVNHRINTVFEQSISFKNGSLIKFIRASENARGNKFHFALYNTDIDYRLLVTVIQPTEIRYREHRR